MLSRVIANTSAEFAIPQIAGTDIASIGFCEAKSDASPPICVAQSALSVRYQKFDAMP